MSRQQIRQQIRHEEDAPGGGQRRIARSRLRVELEHRVEIHDLDTGRRIQFLARHDLEHLLRHAGRIRVAVRARQAQQRAVGRNAAEVHAPGIDADCVEPHAGAAQLSQARDEMFVNGPDVPVILPSHLQHLVRKAVDLLHGEGSVCKRSQHRAAARRAAVESQEVILFHRCICRRHRPWGAPTVRLRRGHINNKYI